MSRLEDKLTREIGFRKKEISELYILVQSTKSSESTRKHLLRGLLLLIYAHWEGFIKSASKKYLKALQEMKIPCNQLQPALKAFYLYSQFKSQQGSEWNKFSVALNFNEKVIFDKDISNEISTKSNLNTEVFKNIVARIGIDDLNIDMKKGIIDDGLLDRRNSIAHGQMIHIDLSDLIIYKDQIVHLLDCYLDLILDAYDNKKYLNAVQTVD